MLEITKKRACYSSNDLGEFYSNLLILPGKRPFKKRLLKQLVRKKRLWIKLDLA
jgi:hypothetical protein